MANNITMDFSDMFKPAGSKKRNVKDETESLPVVPVVDQENAQPNAESTDSVAYVKRHLASLNYDVSSIEMNKYLAKIMETMLSEVISMCRFMVCLIGCCIEIALAKPGIGTCR